MIPGISYEKCGTTHTHLCVVKNFTPELMDIIRQELSKICHGPHKAKSSKGIFSYKATLGEFIKRYSGKKEETKLGMIGELLSHILIFHYMPAIRPASPFFNMEEASIKKGFDLLAIDTDDNSYWITEVKSGEIGKSEKDQKIRTLIDLAINDLKERLPDSDATIWTSAINNVDVALSAGDPQKEILQQYLSDFWEENQSQSDAATKANAILVPVLIEDANNPVELATVVEKNRKIIRKPPFHRHIVFAIQKSTISKVESFLFQEAAAK